MNQSEFKQLYDRFNPVGAFSVADWDTALANWQTFYDEVISADGLPIEKWIKNPFNKYSNIFCIILFIRVEQ